MKGEIDVVQQIDEAGFKRKYLRPQRPVVIKNLVKDQPAHAKWSMDYIREHCGDVMVDLYDNSKTGKTTAFTKPDLKMRFDQYVDHILANKPSSLRMFLFNMFKCRPELRKDFPCPKIFKGLLGRMGFMFFGPKDANVRIHQDIDNSNVLLTQFHGRKKVVLIHPKYSALLYRLPFNTHSMIDLDKPDYNKYPGLQYVPTMECILEPGDTLFMPSGYWHYITYLDGGFSVSYRKMAIGILPICRGILNLFIYLPFDKLMNRLFGLKWFLKKEQIAERRANNEIRKIRESEKNIALEAGYLH